MHRVSTAETGSGLLARVRAETWVRNRRAKILEDASQRFRKQTVAPSAVRGEVRIQLRDPLSEFAHVIHSEVEFLKVMSRTATSIVLLTVLLAGMVMPTGVCAFMCQRHLRAERQGHCVPPADTMPGMVHAHSAMNHSSVEAVIPVLVSQSCRSNCVTTERLAASRKIVPQVTAVWSGAVALGATDEFLAPDTAAAWNVDGSPPFSPPAYAASFSILRV